MDLTSITKLLVAGTVATFGVCELCGQPAAAAPRTALPASAAVMSDGPTPTASPLQVRRDMAKVSTVTLRITGMTCGGCTVAVRTVLRRLDGVTSAEVSYERAQAVVTYDATRVTHAQIIAAVKTLGYTAVVVPALGGAAGAVTPAR